MAFLLDSQAQGVYGKMNHLPKHYGTGTPEALGPMQLHRLKAGPVPEVTSNSVRVAVRVGDLRKELSCDQVLIFQAVDDNSGSTQTFPPDWWLR